MVLSDMADARHALRCIDGCDSQPLPLGQGCIRFGHMCHSPIVAGDQTAGPDATPQAAKIFSAATQRLHVRPTTVPLTTNGEFVKGRGLLARGLAAPGGRPFAAAPGGPSCQEEACHRLLRDQPGREPDRHLARCRGAAPRRP